MQKILVYADTVDELRNQIVDDNLVNLLVSDNCLDAYLKENNRDKEEWWNEYVAEDTLDFMNSLKEIIGCTKLHGMIQIQKKAN